MTNKLAEARKYLDKAEGFSEFSLNDDRVRIGRQRLIMLMKEFAIDYHEAKMKEELTRFMLCLTIDKYQDNKDADIIKEYMDIYFGESAHNETK